LQCTDIDHLLQNLPTCSCSSSPFNYQPDGHVITCNVNIVRNEEVKSLILKGPKFREPRSLKWQQNFISIMDSVEDYARRWAKSELDSSSESVKCIRGILKSRMKHVPSKMRTIYPSGFYKPELLKVLNRLHEEYVLVPADKASTL
jgi:hypothetical protein